MSMRVYTFIYTVGVDNYRRPGGLKTEVAENPGQLFCQKIFRVTSP
jgi:hypothetical protein